MKIMVVSDIHEDSLVLETLVQKYSPDFVLSCGDQAGYYNPKFPLYFVPGNHEDFDWINTFRQNGADEQKICLIEPGYTYLLSDGIEEAHVAGLGGVYKEQFFEGKCKDAYFSRDELEQLKKAYGADILLFHETLPILDIKRDGKVMGCPYLESVVGKLAPKLVFTGHHHQFKEVKKNGTTFYSLGRPRKGFVLLEAEKEKINSRFVWTKNDN